MNSQSDTPSNGIYIILGEINLLLTNLRHYLDESGFTKTLLEECLIA